MAQGVLRPCALGYQATSRRRFKKEQRKLGAEQAQGTSAPELRDQGGGGSKGFQAAAKMVRWALVPENYPVHKLTPEDIGNLKRLLRSQILSLKEGTRAPKFERVWERDGAAVVGCTEGIGDMAEKPIPR
ncbi:hypothetical protein PV326_012727 [Microctonus aethiopoides]|nr:hypothetical protein PV326_012727 [Microctonus aethiopoides]